MTPLDVPELHYCRTIGAERLRKLLDRPKGSCTWCGEPVQRGRRHWCSEACVDRYQEVWSPERIRRLAFKRDRGICAVCGLDTQYWRHWRDKLKTDYSYNRGEMAEHRSDQYPYSTQRNRRGRKNRRRFARYQAAWNKILRHLIAWEADHIVPVVRGGALLGMANIRTLCGRCHKRTTAHQAAERAEERTQARELPKENLLFD